MLRRQRIRAASKAARLLDELRERPPVSPIPSSGAASPPVLETPPPQRKLSESETAAEHGARRDCCTTRL